MDKQDILIENVKEKYPDYLKDESRYAGAAESISFPKTEDEIADILDIAARKKTSITTQGALTGVTAGAVPEGGYILNLSRMKKIIRIDKDEEKRECRITVEPGMLLSELNELIKKDLPGYFFPPDPTESSATLGGMLSCNSSGARSFLYGPTRNYIERICVVFADGAVLDIRRGQEKARKRQFSIKDSRGRTIEGKLPAYMMPQVKNASGYFVADDMDIIDLFIGSEGTLGIITEIELKLIAKPDVVWGILPFFSSEKSAINFVSKIRERDDRPASIEYFNLRALELLRDQKNQTHAFSDIPDIHFGNNVCLYLECHGKSTSEVEETVYSLAETMHMCGADDDMTIVASTRKELEALRQFRHAVPEAVNMRIDELRKTVPEITKLGTDMAVPDECLMEMMQMYNDDLTAEKLEYVIFGHIGDNHLHVNVLPRTIAEMELAKDIFLKWTDTVAEKGGTVSAEHGIGKLKRDFLLKMYGEESVSQMRELKALFDPDLRLNEGNMFA